MRRGETGECAFCSRTDVLLSSVTACAHCDAIFYTVWDWSGGAKPPSRSTFDLWAADLAGPVTENRTRKRFLRQWRDSSGTLVRIPASGVAVNSASRAKV